MRPLTTATMLFLLTACGRDPVIAVSGTVAGAKFKASSAYFGGPFVAFVEASGEECMDFAWVEKGIDENDNPPVDRNVRALIVAFKDAAVAAGNHSVENDSPVDARFIEVQDAALTVHRSREGFVDITELEDESSVTGTLELTFDDGNIGGEFDLDWCTNLSSKY